MSLRHSPDFLHATHCPQVVQDLIEARFDAVDGHLQSLSSAGDSASEQALGTHCATLQAFAEGCQHYVEQLPVWKRQCPDSVWPDVVACLLWEKAASETRGQGLAEDVSEGQWQQAHLACDALFLQALDVAQRQPLPWVMTVSLMRSVLVFGEPDWLMPWLTGQSSDAELAALHQRRQAALAHWPNLPPVPALPAVPPTRLVAALAAYPRREGEPQGFFWLHQALQASPVGAWALELYAFLRTPRWGGSHEEILWLADSPLAARLDESQRNAIRLVAWLDDLDADSVDVEDDAACQAAFQRGRHLLERPLPASARARVSLALGDLAYLADHMAHAQAYYAQTLTEWPQLTAADDVLYRMLCVAAHSGMDPWFGQVVSQSRLQSAFAAVLYGLLCDTGWCGVPRDPAQAEHWYRQALTYGPMSVPEGECPFNDVYYAFDESLHGTALRHMVEYAAGLGVPEMQFALAYLHEEEDPVTALHWYRQAGAHGFGRALYNLSVVCDRGVEEGGLPGWDVEALRELGNDCEVACLEELVDQSTLTPRALNRIPNCFIGIHGYLTRHKVDSERVRRNLAVLRQYAEQDWPEAMRVLAYHYQAEDCPQGHDYSQAVMWCERACRLQPDDEQNVRLRERLSQGLMGGMRYRRALAKAPRS
ncbi:DUF4034 domain-containing protein [Pseudomonas monteilii]